MTRRFAWLAVPLVALALYAVTLGGTFVYDDVAVIHTDRRIADPHLWGQYWSDSYNFGVDNLYRPLVSMTYAVQRYWHGETAWPYHLANVLLHAIASGLVAWFARKLAMRCRSPQSAAIGIISGLLFAAHPVHVEAVANIVGRAELMCAIATLIAIGVCLDRLTWPRVIIAWLACVAAILCKEQGILVPAMIGVTSGLLYLWERSASARRDDVATLETAAPSPPHSQKQRTPEAATLFLLMMATIAGIVHLRENVLHLKFWWDRKFLDPWIQPLSDSVGVDRWLATVTIAGRYLGLLVAPVTLRIDYGGPIVPGVFRASDPFFWLGVVAIALWFGLGAVAWRRRDRLLGTGLLLFAISYVLISNIPTIIGVNVAERLMYLPSAFFVIVVARLLVGLPRRATVAIVSLIVVFFSIRTVSYAWRWNDRLAFYEYAARVEPRSLKAALLAMQEHLDRHEFAASERYARMAIAIDPTSDEAWLRLSSVLVELNRFDEAEQAIAKAQSIRATSKSGQFLKRLIERRDATSTRPSDVR